MSFTSRSPIFSRFSARGLFWTIAAGLIFLVSWIAVDYGITWDEWMDANNGMLTLRYLLTFGADTSYTQFWHGYLYSQLFYTVVGTLYGLLSGGLRDFVFNGLHQDTHLLTFFHTSHWINALFGCAAMIFAGLLARLVAGWRAGLITLIFMILTPGFFGASFNNPKDIPMAAGYIASLYFMIRFLKEQPRPRLDTQIFLVLSIAAGIGARAAGLILPGYLLLFSALYWVTSSKENRAPLALSAARPLIIAVSGYFCGLLVWPYALQDPLRNPLSALQQFSNFDYGLGLLLFEGKKLAMNQIPWYYVLKSMFITVPFFIHAGLIFLVLSLRRLLRETEGRFLFMIFFTFAFPVFYQIYKSSTVYDGWRHFFFVYPPLAVLAGIAWHHFAQSLRTPASKTVLAAVLAVLLLEPLTWMVRNHPNQYVYFNPAVGGVNGALGRYETDYWSNSFRGCAEWLADYHTTHHPGERALVRADGSVMSTYPYLRAQLGNSYYPYYFPENFLQNKPYFSINYPPVISTRQPWDYAIIMTRGADPLKLQKRKWPDVTPLFEIRADDTPLCAVIKSTQS